MARPRRRLGDVRLDAAGWRGARGPQRVGPRSGDRVEFPRDEDQVSRYLIFDLGVRRLCAGEGARRSPDRMGQLFEQFVGLELVRLSRRRSPATAVSFWRDPDGPEVDWLIARGGTYVPIEVTRTDAPAARDARHLRVFLDEYPGASAAFVVCRAPRRQRPGDRIDALPWQELPVALEA